MKYIKITLGLFLLLIIGVIILFIYESRMSNEANTGYNNKENFKMVNLGMNSEDVIKIMGLPESMMKEGNKTYLYYSLPIGVSGQCIIILDSLDKVVNKGYVAE
jgi:hypothetical protein